MIDDLQALAFDLDRSSTRRKPLEAPQGAATRLDRPRAVPPRVGVWQVGRREAQAAVGRIPLRDVLLSLRRSGIILSFRIYEDRIEVHAERALSFLFDASDA